MGQYKRRFLKGEKVREEGEKESHVIASFRRGGYEVHEAEGGGYELINEGVFTGVFSEARVEKHRILFKLSHGMNLEISDRGAKEILREGKAELCGLLASDGTIYEYMVCPRDRSPFIQRQVSLSSMDHEVIEIYKDLFEDIYGFEPHEYVLRRRTKKGESEEYHAVTYRRAVYYDLENLGIKGPEPYEFHPPIEHLDDEGKKAYLRGFFTGDGCVHIGKDEKRHEIRISSSYKEGLEEIRDMLEDLGFHVGEIHEHHRKSDERIEYSIYIPEEDHLKFIEEIGSERKEHIRKFERIREIDEEKKGGGKKSEGCYCLELG